MFQAAVAMFCGPVDSCRIDPAIELACSLKLPLFIAGDAFGGAEIERFRLRAVQAGVTIAVPVYDERSCTLSDAQGVARQLRTEPFQLISHVHLVTDWWHMERALAMLEREIARLTAFQRVVTPAPVLAGPQPCNRVLANERQGLRDYLDGVYGQRTVVDPLRHSQAL